MSSGYDRMGAGASGGTAPRKVLYFPKPQVVTLDVIRTDSIQALDIKVGTVTAREVAYGAADPTSIGLGEITRQQAVQMGYTGDQCNTCFSMKMQIAGHCMVCADCGTTTGCS